MRTTSSTVAPAALDWRHDHYVALRTALLGAPTIDLPRMRDWPPFWDAVFCNLKQAGYARSTCKLYRQVLRSLRAFGLRRPCDITPELAQRFVRSKANAHHSAHSLAMTISVLRTIFEALCGRPVTMLTATPKRPDRLPTILSTGETVELLRAGRSVCDQLLLGLLYGCALCPGELQALNWDDISGDGDLLWVDESAHGPGRRLAVPDILRPILREGKRVCRADEPVFPGRRVTSPISKRAIELIVRRAARDARLIKPVTPMCLRHSYAVHQLEAGSSIREVQVTLGHASIETTQRYLRCILPKVESPLQRIWRRQNDDRLAMEPAPPSPPIDPMQHLASISLDAAKLPFRAQRSSPTIAEFLAFMKSALLTGLFKRTHAPPH